MAIIKKNTCVSGADLAVSAAKAAAKSAADAAESAAKAEAAVEQVKPHIGENGNWWVGDEDTYVPATSPGEPGPQGPPGDSPYIGDNGNWWVGDEDTHVPATTAVEGIVTKDDLAERLKTVPDVVETTEEGWQEAVGKTDKPNIYIIK